MGLLGNIISKGVTTAARNSTIKAVGNAATNVIATKANASGSGVASNDNDKDDVVVKNGVKMIKPTRSSEAYCGENALDIAKELLGVGFESVTLKPVNTLSGWSKKKYGEIKSISINGKTNFFGSKKVPSSVYIVIEYFDFKKNVDGQVYESVTKITPGIMRRAEPHVAPQANSSAPSGGSKRFCPYCGSVLPVADAKFCSTCGKAI